jgi:hypothetical protein
MFTPNPATERVKKSMRSISPVEQNVAGDGGREIAVFIRLYNPSPVTGTTA